MPLELEFIEADGYLHMKVRGENNLQSVLDYAAEAYRECERRNCWKLLIEENLQGPAMTITDVYHAASRGTERVGRPVVVAFVDVNPLHPKQNVEFAGKVALNRGLNIRVFDNLPDAQAWIAKVSAPPVLPPPDRS